ncbi:MAG: hypothetical protein V4590_04950 [Bacteroidota bacterium]
MKYFTLGLLGLYALAANAQQEVQVRYPYPEWEVYHNKPKGEKHQVHIYTVEGKDKRLETSITYGEKGLTEKDESFKRNGSLKSITLREFNDSNRLTKYQVIKRNKNYRYQTYSYRNLTQIFESFYYYKDTLAPLSTIMYEYYPNTDKYKSYTSYDKHKTPAYRYEYDYYENGSRKETRFFSKGKLKHTWVYACDVKGELSDNKTVKICKNRIYAADSSFTEIYESSYKGKASRNIIKSTADGKVLENCAFDAKGRQTFKSVYQYNDAGKLVKHITYKKDSNQPQVIEIYEYNSDAGLIASVRLNSNGDIKSRKEFSYN